MFVITTIAQKDNWNNFPVGSLLYFTGRAFSAERPNAKEYLTLREAKAAVQVRGFDDVKIYSLSDLDSL